MNPKILLVDDEPDVLAAYERVLRKRFAVETAPGGEQALAMLAAQGPFAVLVADLSNGARFETYVMQGQRGSGVICVNGAAAKLVTAGDRIIIMAFAYVTPDEAKDLQPKVVLVDEKNRIVRKL